VALQNATANHRIEQRVSYCWMA